MVELKDGLEFLKSIEKNSIDLILTDPPYQISKESGMQNARDKGEAIEDWHKKFHIQTKFGEWDEDFDVEMLAEYIKEFYRVLRKGGTLICFYDLWKLSYLANSLEKNKFKQLRFIEWVKTNPVPINSKINYLTNSREIALTAVKGGKPTFHSEYDNGIYSQAIYQGKTIKIGDKKIKERFHPTQKSLPLFEDLIKKHSNPDDLVLDPFSGSGTTMIAALNTNRKFVGCEISKEYYDKSLERIKIFYPDYYNKYFTE